MHKRLKNPFTEKSDNVLDDIPGVEISTNKLPEFKSKEFLVMSSGVIYVRDIFYSNDINKKWRYVHDDAIILFLCKDNSFMLEDFRRKCSDLTNQHNKLYVELYKDASRKYLHIRKAINTFTESLQNQYSKLGITDFINRKEFQPWV